MSDRKEIVVGIDVGTNNLSAAVFWNGCIRVLEGAHRERTIPSYAFVNKHRQIVVGSWDVYKYDESYNAYGIYGEHFFL